MKLGELINSRRRDQGLSLEAMAKRARDCGYELTKTTLSAFANHPLPESPKRRTMEALAIALGCSYPEVVLAVAQSLVGDQTVIDVTSEQRVRSWLTLTEGRTDEEVASLLRVVQTVTAALDAAQQGGEVSPQSGHDGQPSDNATSPERRSG
ncbi:MAG TPA: helix-turn-helix transcriptional regulator [Microbacterium sp.]|nr:helix-turn-helix transcriptional regulator [Microbacterium sp.]